jgi:hypothetical protein
MFIHFNKSLTTFAIDLYFDCMKSSISSISNFGLKIFKFGVARVELYFIN